MLQVVHYLLSLYGGGAVQSPRAKPKAVSAYRTSNQMPYASARQ